MEPVLVTTVPTMGYDRGSSPSSVGEYDARLSDNVRGRREHDPHNPSEDEELDHAIALSLADEEQRRSRGHDTDEELARALQESMQMRTPLSRALSIPVQHVTSRRVCEGCKREIGFGRYLSCMGGMWHPSCFCCHACAYPITELEFSMSENRPTIKAATNSCSILSAMSARSLFQQTVQA
ncbi:hypothetical protein L7F22_051994 [Adiantum nelumboides]|nr:hypothetical protein [Adiantum nelumboides]